MKNYLCLLGMLLYVFCSYAQDSTALPKKLVISGYIKSLQTISFDKTFGQNVSGNLIHNRLNIKWKPSETFVATAELRNRLYWGEEVKLTPGFASLLRNDNEKFNLQKTWIQNPSLVLHTNVERLYVDYRRPSWNLRVGRQRINWGLTTTWNPNDIFNAYNFLDFDYEERPGADGAKLQYTFNNSSNAEIAYINTGKKDGNIAAIKYSLNRWNYDMQLISGWYNNHATIGAGWAGSIKEAGFKGEMQYFIANKDSSDHFNMSLEADYMFKKGWYLNLSFLFNSRGLYQPVADWTTINLKLSPENLMPTKWNMVITSAKELNPLLSANMSVLYAPGTNLLILLPSVQYSIATNLDINLVWQSFFADLNNTMQGVNHRCYLRLKWSF